MTTKMLFKICGLFIMNLKEVKKMNNRIKELRKLKKISQKGLVSNLGITQQALSNYEKEKRVPDQETWQALADFFNVSVAYLKGAYSKKEILAILQEAYKKATRQEVGGYDLIKDDIGFNVDLIMIAKGEIEPNEPQLKGMLSPNEVNDFEFWQTNFSFVFNSVAVNWLVTRPIETTKEEVLKAINESLQIEISKLTTDTTEHQNEYGEWLESPSQYLLQRQEFINNHIQDDGTLSF